MRDDAKLVHHWHTCDRHDATDTCPLPVPLKTLHQLEADGMTYIPDPATDEKVHSNKDLQSSNKKVKPSPLNLEYKIMYCLSRRLVTWACAMQKVGEKQWGRKRNIINYLSGI